MKWTQYLALATILVLLVGCGKDEGNAEKAGAAIDSAVDRARDAIEDMDGDGPMEDAGEAIDDAYSAAKETTADVLASAKEDGTKALDSAKASSQQLLDDVAKKAEETRLKAKAAMEKD